MLPLREEFPLGCTVRLTKKGHQLLPRGSTLRERAGEVKGYARTGDIVYVLWRWLKHPQAFHRDFIRRIWL